MVDLVFFIAIPLLANYWTILPHFPVTFIFEMLKLFHSWIQGLLFNLANGLKRYMVVMGPDGSRERNKGS